MWKDKLLSDHLYKQQFSEFKSNVGFESLLKDIKSFKLFLQLVCQKYKIKSSIGKNNESRECKTGAVLNEEESARRKFDSANFTQLAQNLLDKFESMKIWEIFHEIHSKTENNIRADIISFMNLIQNKLSRKKKHNEIISLDSIVGKESIISEAKVFNIVEKNISRPKLKGIVKEKNYNSQIKQYQQNFVHKPKELYLKLFQNCNVECAMERILSPKIPVLYNKLENSIIHGENAKSNVVLCTDSKNHHNTGEKTKPAKQYRTIINTKHEQHVIQEDKTSEINLVVNGKVKGRTQTILYTDTGHKPCHDCVGNYDPSTYTVQNVSDILLSIGTTLSKAPSSLKNQKIMDLNAPASMKQAINLLAYIAKYIDNKDIVWSH